MIYKGTKLYIPGKFRQSVLSKSHETHQGKLAMLNNIKHEFWWPNLILDIIAFLKECKTWAKNRPIKRGLLSTWPVSENWERLHIDWN